MGFLNQQTERLGAPLIVRPQALATSLKRITPESVTKQHCYSIKGTKQLSPKLSIYVSMSLCISLSIYPSLYFYLAYLPLYPFIHPSILFILCCSSLVQSILFHSILNSILFYHILSILGILGYAILVYSILFHDPSTGDYRGRYMQIHNYALAIG